MEGGVGGGLGSRYAGSKNLHILGPQINHSMEGGVGGVVWEVDMQAAHRHRNRMQRMYYGLYRSVKRNSVHGVSGCCRNPVLL